MLGRKIACNATNSAAIDIHGNLWVWGSARYGLCGPIGPSTKEKAGASQKKSNDGGATDGVSKPTKLALLEEDTTDMVTSMSKCQKNDSGQAPLSAFNLLDPDPRKEPPDQVFFAKHISFGSYHGGVVCNDISTNYEFEELPAAQSYILDDLKEFLLRKWKELERKNSAEVETLHDQYQKKQQRLEDSAGRPAFAESPGQEGEVSEQLKIEYMLRHYAKDSVSTTFPFMPLSWLRDLFVNDAKMSFKDPAKYNQLFEHLVKCANTVLCQDGMTEMLDKLKEEHPGDKFINLKELRDQILRRRCSNGKLFMYGIANEGRLGVPIQELEGTKTTQEEAKKFDMLAKGMQLVQFSDPTIQVTKVECGSSFTLVLTSQGMLYSWGFGKSGSLGLGEKSQVKTPEQIENLYTGEMCQNMIDISCGSSHSLSIDGQGAIYSWGNGQGGRLGHNQEVGENAPRQIEGPLTNKFVKQIEAGDASSACVLHDRTVYMWGSGLHGRLGNGTSVAELKPQLSQELKDKQVSSITKGTNTTFAIRETSQVLGWGSSKNGKLGLQLSNGKNYDLPREIRALKDVDVYQIAAGPFHTILLTVDGNLFAMGNSKDGKLGFKPSGGTVVDVEQPQAIRTEARFFCHKVPKTEMKKYALFSDYDDYATVVPAYTKNDEYEINQICCGENFQVFVTNNGEVYSCGSNSNGQLGTKEDSDEELATMALSHSSKKKQKDGDNDENTRKANDKPVDEGQVMPENLRKKVRALEKRKDQGTPAKLEALSKEAGQAKYIAVGQMHAIAVLEGEGGVYAWGKNDHGQLGIANRRPYTFSPCKLKAFGADQHVRQVACGESHTVFLMATGLVMTCGANEFGQLGLQQQAGSGQDGSKDTAVNTPTLIEKQALDSVVYVAAGRFHTVVIRRQTEGDKNDEPNDKDASLDAGMGEMEENPDDQAIVVDVRHELYGWGRAYHGQLGLKDKKNVQWVPKKIRLRKDPRLAEEEQPKRFMMVTCGEKHTLVLAVNGMIWWAGEKAAVGVEDPNEFRRNKFEARVESDSFECQFTPLSGQTANAEFNRTKMKFISSNFNSKLNFAITEDNYACLFGQDYKTQEKIPFQKLLTENRYIFADSGKNFQSFIHIERLPYTWGEIKNGKLGIDDSDPDINRSQYFDAKNKEFLQPCLIPDFEATLNRLDSSHIPQNVAQKMRQKYNNVKDTGADERVEELSEEEANFEIRFPVQQKLKLQDQAQFEKDLMQQDVDLIINFKKCIKGIYEKQSVSDKVIRNSIMKAQDSISSRIHTFPVANIDKLEDIEVQVPKIIILNKQIYEILFTLLQTHPCYLINWLCAAIRQDVHLFDSHPQAFLEDNEQVTEIRKKESVYQTSSQKQIQGDEYCYLLITIYGGLKNIRNDRRILNNLMMIGVKVFDYELDQSVSASRKIDYTLDDIFHNRVECVFSKIHRLVFQSQYENLAFVQELFTLIVKKLYRDRSTYRDGADAEKAIAEDIRQENKEAQLKAPYDIFDYESVINDHRLTRLRSTNLQRFLEEVLEEIIIGNIDPKNGPQKHTACENFFSSEILLMTLKAHENMTNVAIPFVTKRANMCADDGYDDNTAPTDNSEAARSAAEQARDKVSQFTLRVLFEDLCLRLQNLKPHEVIQIIGHRAYRDTAVMNVANKRNNFYYIGEALRSIISGGQIHFSSVALEPFKNFVESKEKRAEILKLIAGRKTKEDMLSFDQILTQQTIEEAMEINNPVCTIQLRNVVYVHNQLVTYGEDHIYIKGFASDHQGTDSGKQQSAKTPGKKSVDQGSSSSDYGDDDDSSEASEDPNEMDPIKMIMDQLGNQIIILKIYDQDQIAQDTLNKSMNFLIRTRTFENFNEIVKCHGCNAIVYEGLLPHRRFQSGLEMCQWVCSNRMCRYPDNAEMSVACRKCKYPRPLDTVPKDVLFPLYLPLNPAIPTNAAVAKMERLLQIMPMVGAADDLVQGVKDRRADELKKGKGKDEEGGQAGQADFDKVNIYEEFLDMTQAHVQDKRNRQANIKFETPEDEKAFEWKAEAAFYQTLTGEIDQNIVRRLEHEALIERNKLMIKELDDRLLRIEMKQKNFVQAITRIQERAKYGIGSDSLLNLKEEQAKQIYAGRLAEMSKQKGSGGGSKKDKNEQNKGQGASKSQDLNQFFDKMQNKQTMQVNNPRLQKQLEAKRPMRNLLKNQFAQYSSYPAQDLLEQGVVDCIKLGGQKIEPIIKKCNYLFYELKTEDGSDQEGGYKVELSFEEKTQDICGIGAKLGTIVNSSSKSSVGNANQSILSTFTISNETLAEMKRIMATKCTVNLGGTTFNIFKLVKLINMMKTKNQQYADGDSAKPRKDPRQADDEEKADDEETPGKSDPTAATPGAQAAK